LVKIHNKKTLALLIALTVCTPFGLAQPPSYVDKIFFTPDLTQSDPRGQFAENGANFCAPVAVSNSFVWLSEHGYPQLLPGKNNNLPDKDKERDTLYNQIALAKTLSSSEFMNTKAEEGTYVDEVLLGIKKYILKQGYSIKQLSYQGFRSNLAEFNSGTRNPKLASLKQGIIGKSGVWLNIGWYQSNPASGTYVRVGGHWVTLVGYGVDKNGKPANNVFVIHNPSARAGATFHNDYVIFEPIQGVLVSRRGLLGFPRPAWGFYKILGDLSPVPGSDTAILESAVILELY